MHQIKCIDVFSSGFNVQTVPHLDAIQRNVDAILESMESFRQAVEKNLHTLRYSSSSFVQRHILPAIHLAVLAGEVEMARCLLAKGVDVDARGDASETALLIAVRLGNTEMASLLLQNGADVHPDYDDIAREPLWIAAARGDVKMTSLLLQNGADILVDGGEEIHLPKVIEQSYDTARAGKYIEVASLLLQKVRDVDGRRNMAEFLLLPAAERGHAEILEMLFDLGVPQRPWEPSSRTPSLLYATVLSGNLEAVKLALGREGPSGINLQDGSGQTPLHIAVGSKFGPIIAELLENGADTSLQDYSGSIPLQLGIRAKDFGIVQRLFSKTQKDLRPTRASTWRSVFPNNTSGNYIEINNLGLGSISQLDSGKVQMRRRPRLMPLDGSSLENFMEADSFLENFLRTEHPCERIMYVNP